MVVIRPVTGPKKLPNVGDGPIDVQFVVEVPDSGITSA
jgi:hypothetical protein